MHYPRTILVEVTQRCNLFCIMCARRVDHRPAGDLSLELFKKLEQVLPMIPLVILTGHGESLLHKDFFEMLRICKAAGCKTRIITNATIIDDEMAKKLVTYGLDELVVSMDAAEKELFEKIRTGASFSTVVDNIRRVNRFKRQLESETPVLMFESVGMEQNIHQLPSLVKLAHELDVVRIGIAPLAEHNPEVRGQNLCQHPHLLKKYLDEAEEMARKLEVKIECGDPYREASKTVSTPSGIIRQLKRILKITNNIIRGIPTLDGRTYLFRAVIQKLEKAFTTRKLIRPRIIVGTKVHCSDPWRFAFICWNGKVRPCCGSEHTFGDLAQNSFEEIWNIDAYQMFRLLVASNNPPLECMRCAGRRKTTCTE